ncbi:copper resistance protein CopD [Natrinema longum]|uniref:Copper resistance protein CopD n=1 Tax=Natrinema longum TaxID=370324 RepID=A0A8A2U637_9EURY|nr:copper resistance protein CopD [Natrinema longum]MBZ6494513.1 copper resistance protein CopD [Natrinema longum]QSW84164.1 copper resistance protein CopD [Natrinema longum]
MVDVLAARTIHLVVAALWAGSVCFVAAVVLPLARDGAFNTTHPLEVISGKLTTISRVSSVVLLLSGGHLAGNAYTFGSLFGTTNGRLVVAMVALWLLLTALVEIGTKRFETGLTGKKIREPARDSLPTFRAAAVTAIALLVVAGLLSANVGLLL